MAVSTVLPCCRQRSCTGTDVTYVRRACVRQLLTWRRSATWSSNYDRSNEALLKTSSAFRSVVSTICTKTTDLWTGRILLRVGLTHVAPLAPLIEYYWRVYDSNTIRSSASQSQSRRKVRVDSNDTRLTKRSDSPYSCAESAAFW